MKLSKTQQAILNKERVGHIVWTLKDGRVGVSGERAVMAAKKLEKLGLIEFKNSSEHGRIGNNWDGSYKYGYIFAGLATIVNSTEA